MKEMYRRGAHLMPPAHAKEGEEAARLRSATLEALDAGASLSGWDLDGRRSSAGSTSAVATSRAPSWKPPTSRAARSAAPTWSAPCSRGPGSRRPISDKARAAGANLGEADLAGARLTGVDLTGAVLFKARLADADLTGARLDQAELTEATFDKTILAGVKARDTTVAKADSVGPRLSRRRAQGAVHLPRIERGARRFPGARSSRPRRSSTLQARARASRAPR